MEPALIQARSASKGIASRTARKAAPIIRDALRVFGVGGLDFAGGDGVDQPFVVTDDEMGFCHREHLDGIGELFVALEVGRDRHGVAAAGMRPGERAGAEVGIGLDGRKLRILDVEAPFMSWSCRA